MDYQLPGDSVLSYGLLLSFHIILKRKYKPAGTAAAWPNRNRLISASILESLCWSYTVVLIQGLPYPNVSE